MKIQDFGECSVENLLRFLYTGEVPEDDENAVENYKIAVKFKAGEMKKFCEATLLKLLNNENAFEYFTLGIELSSRNLKLQAFKKLENGFGSNLSDELIDNPTALFSLIKAKQSFDSLWEKMRQKN